MRPLSIYCDWALHDELGGDARLTEEMTMDVLDVLERWRAKHGVRFDYYVFDAFWFDQPGDYKSFHPDMWPNGFGPALQRIKALGMTPGLWFDVTGGQVLGHKPWEPSLDISGGRSYCLFDGPYGPGLQEGMRHAAEAWGVRLFKFDLANFYAVTEKFRDLDAGEIYARNVAAYRRVLEGVRAQFPDVVYLAYNGFDHVPGYMETTTGAVVPGIDPAWLDVLDYVYSGDTRPADTPCTSLSRSTTLYQDHMVYKFHRSGYPMARIDDCGCMVGNTNTIYYLGATGWRRNWVQHLARGSRKPHFYGDVHLLSDEDAAFVKAGADLFFDLYATGAETRMVGGVPCQSPWHGFLTGNADNGLLAVVNSTPARIEAAVSVDGLEAAHVLFHDEGWAPECEVRGDGLSVRLAPEQMALLGLGEKATDECVLGAEVGGDAVTPDSVRLDLPFVFAEGRAECTVPGSALAGPGRGEHSALRVSFRLRERNRAYRHAVSRDQVVTDAMTVSVEADGRP
ncbi:MAG: alpha-amylase family protein, partial [Planctomycetota bacterium]